MYIKQYKWKRFHKDNITMAGGAAMPAVATVVTSVEAAARK